LPSPVLQSATSIHLPLKSCKNKGETEKQIHNNAFGCLRDAQSTHPRALASDEARSIP
jgi:hypothetical protein